jgi:hypothetical protein
MTKQCGDRLALAGVDQNGIRAVGLGGRAPFGIGIGLHEQHALAESLPDQPYKIPRAGWFGGRR